MIANIQYTDDEINEAIRVAHLCMIETFNKQSKRLLSPFYTWDKKHKIFNLTQGIAKAMPIIDSLRKELK